MNFYLFVAPFLKSYWEFKVIGSLVIFFSFLFLFLFFEAVLTSLSPVDPVESVSNSETPMNSDTGKVTRNDTEEENSEPSTRDIERNRTEFVCDSPPEGENKGASENEAFLQGTEERMSYQCESGAEFPQAAAAAAGATAPPTPRDSLQLSIKQRLARLQLSPEFTFTAGLAAEVAARSLSFTTMQEQTFGDEEEEQIAEGSENEVEEK